MTDTSDALTDAIADLVPPLLHGLDALGFVARHLHPPHLAQVLEQVGRLDEPVLEALPAFQALAWPDHLHPLQYTVEFKRRLHQRCNVNLSGILESLMHHQARFRQAAIA